MCSSNHFEAGAFIRTRKGIKHPDIQYHFFPGAVEQQKDIVQVHAYQVHCGTMRPKSRGYLKLKSNKSRDKPIIEPQLLSVKEDLDDICEGIKLTVEIMNAKSFEIDRHKPINFEEKMVFNQNELEEWAKNHLESAYHCSGTCAMGKVTEPDGKVKGIKNLRVCDASIMPYVTSGNTNAPTIMIAEKISDLIKGKSLPPSNASYYISPNWKSIQREII
jgi:choline dehydrogenase